MMKKLLRLFGLFAVFILILGCEEEDLLQEISPQENSPIVTESLQKVFFRDIAPQVDAGEATGFSIYEQVDGEIPGWAITDEFGNTHYTFELKNDNLPIYSGGMASSNFIFTVDGRGELKNSFVINYQPGEEWFLTSGDFKNYTGKVSYYTPVFETLLPSQEYSRGNLVSSTASSPNAQGRASGCNNFYIKSVTICTGGLYGFKCRTTITIICTGGGGSGGAYLDGPNYGWGQVNIGGGSVGNPDNGGVSSLNLPEDGNDLPSKNQVVDGSWSVPSLGNMNIKALLNELNSEQSDFYHSASISVKNQLKKFLSENTGPRSRSQAMAIIDFYISNGVSTATRNFVQEVIKVWKENPEAEVDFQDFIYFLETLDNPFNTIIFDDNFSVNLLNDECTRTIVRDELIMSLNAGFVNSIRNIFGSDDNVTLTFRSDDNLPEDVNASTDFDTQSNIDSGIYNIYITFSDDYLSNNPTKLSIASTVIHEMMHAKFIYSYLNGNFSSEFSEYTDLLSKFQDFISNRSESNAENLADVSHLAMIDFIGTMSYSLFKYAEQQGMNVTREYCTDIMKGSFFNTPALQSIDPGNNDSINDCVEKAYNEQENNNESLGDDC